MPQINTVWMIYRIIGVAVVALMLAGCTERDFGEQKHPLLLAENLSEWIDKNPCGVLHVRSPLFNVTGHFTTEVRPNTSLSLFVTPDTTFNASLYVVERCRAIGRMQLQDLRRFRLGPLPQGNYVVMVDGRSFEQGQGFPVLDPINDPNYALINGSGIVLTCNPSRHCEPPRTAAKQSRSGTRQPRDCFVATKRLLAMTGKAMCQ